MLTLGDRYCNQDWRNDYVQPKAAGLKTIEGGDFSFTGVVTKQQGTNPTQVNHGQMVAIYQPQKLVLVKTFLLQHQEKELVHQTLLCQQVKYRNLVNIGNDGNVQWQIHGVIGNPGTTTITDQAQDGQTIVPGTFKITFFGHWLTQNGCHEFTIW